MVQCNAALALLQKEPLAEVLYFQGSCHAGGPCPCGVKAGSYALLYRQCKTCLQPVVLGDGLGAASSQSDQGWELLEPDSVTPEMAAPQTFQRMLQKSSSSKGRSHTLWLKCLCQKPVPRGVPRQ